MVSESRPHQSPPPLPLILPSSNRTSPLQLPHRIPPPTIPNQLLLRSTRVLVIRPWINPIDPLYILIRRQAWELDIRPDRALLPVDPLGRVHVSLRVHGSGGEGLVVAHPEDVDGEGVGAVAGVEFGGLGFYPFFLGLEPCGARSQPTLTSNCVKAEGAGHLQGKSTLLCSQ
jgi:hypothetical protein